MTNYGDDVIMQSKFWAKLANDYLNTASPDPGYLAKLLTTAAEWQAKYDAYLAHLRVTNTSYQLAA